MKLNFLKTITIASVVTLSGAVLPACAAERLQVSVPFSFMLGSTKMPAGDYNVSESDNGMVTFSGAKTSAMVLTVPSDYSKANTNGLSFSSADNDPVLTSIQVEGGFGRQIPSHSADRKAALVSAR